MRFFQSASLLPLGISLGLAQGPGFCYCPTGLACSGDMPQCATDNTGATMCCASGQKAINGQCSPSSNTLCPDAVTVCPGATPQCTIDNTGATICCAPGQKGINGQCSSLSSNLCTNGVTVCSGATPQCTINVSVYVDTTGGAASDTVCCPIGQKALNGKCYPGSATLMPCYRNNIACDWGQNYYCAWNEGNADSMCCRLNEYYNGFSCVRKP